MFSHGIPRGARPVIGTVGFVVWSSLALSPRIAAPVPLRVIAGTLLAAGVVALTAAHPERRGQAGRHAYAAGLAALAVLFLSLAGAASWAAGEYGPGPVLTVLGLPAAAAALAFGGRLVDAAETWARGHVSARR